jgi:hypothetical protein
MARSQHRGRHATTTWSPPMVLMAEIAALALGKTLVWLAYRRRHLGWHAQGAVMTWERAVPRRPHRAKRQRGWGIRGR